MHLSRISDLETQVATIAGLQATIARLEARPPEVVEKVVEKPIEKIVEKIVEKPVEKIVDRQVDNPAHLSRIRDLETQVAVIAGLQATIARLEARPPEVVEKIVYLDAPEPVAIDHALALKYGYKLKGDDDLTIVEGIGPAIAHLLNEHGVHTFVQLSKKTVDELNGILHAGGARFRNHHPDTWARQAQMAAQNRWEELRAWQDSLNGGLERTDA